MLLISACLLGENCKYDGGNNRCDSVIRLVEGRSFLPVCPEEDAGLPVPRAPAEIRKGRVYDREGRDLTEAFRRGALASLGRGEAEAFRRGESIEGAVLKAFSPSCGCGLIYDGSFSKTRVAGDGVFVQMLKVRGIPVVSENDENLFGEKERIRE